MFILLFTYRDEAVPELPIGITFNAMISVLIAAAKIAMLSGVTSAMGQIKWKWFRQNSSSLRNLDLFDEASRGGPWGAIHFLTKVKWRSTAAVGAVVLLLSLAMDPFAQQLITYPNGHIYRDSPDASIKVARSLNLSRVHQDFDLLTQRYILEAILNNPRTLTTSCPGANCTYPLFQSVSWCPRCEDITSDVVLQGCDMAFDLELIQRHSNQSPPPLSCNISASYGKQMTTWNSMNLSVSQSREHRPSVRLNFGLSYIWEIHNEYVGQNYDWVRQPESQSQKGFLGERQSTSAIVQVDLEYDITHPLQALKVKYAIGCVMSPCVRQYSVTTSGGVTSIQSLKISDGIAALLSDSRSEGRLPLQLTGDKAFGSRCWVSNYTFLSSTEAAINDHSLNPNDGAMYCPNGNSFDRCAVDPQFTLCEQLLIKPHTLIADMLYGNQTTTYQLASYVPWDNFTLSGIGADKLNTRNSSYTYQFVQDNGLNATLHSIAEALTALMQNISTKTITGQVAHTQTYVQVRWLWLLYPVVVIFIGIFFVLFTIAETIWINKDTPVWKNSNLPLIYHGLLTDIDERIRFKTMEMKEMEKRARDTFVRFDGTGLKVF